MSEKKELRNKILRCLKLFPEAWKPSPPDLWEYGTTRWGYRFGSLVVYDKRLCIGVFKDTWRVRVGKNIEFGWWDSCQIRKELKALGFRNMIQAVEKTIDDVTETMVEKAMREMEKVTKIR